MCLGAGSVLFALMGLSSLVQNIFLLGPMQPDLPTWARIYGVVFGLYFLLALPVVIKGWWHSMYTASYLCRDEVIAVIKNVRTVDPTSDNWEAVAQAALGLIEKMELPQVCAVHDKNERANAAHAHCVR